ncbi:hypothetical protein K435DRAFT_969488 [Dendrothele bispora CBS 962.96]|uniref:1,3-beta-glucanosyltransferase n=1 Tax=Dendrothele bispora (strain CBS 962.96) TaxID=1314807 RepID=A0A4S8LHN7_DENBC|nr:hypothetical protein K435DRAFT_969488 [Dendrothele bispora CBS 962.96]
MRGEVCVGFASFLALAATILLIFAHVGQINTSNVPRGIYLARVNVSQYGVALAEAFLNPVDGLYTNDSNAPLQTSAGLRQYYQFGLYSYCGYVNETAGICSNTTAARPFTPYDYLVDDMSSTGPLDYKTLSGDFIPFTTFLDSHYLTQTSRAAYYMILLGTISAAVAFFSGIAKHGVTFFISAAAAVISSLFLLIGAAIWTVILNRSDTINGFVLGSQTNQTPVGIVVSTGPGLYILWAAFAIMFVSNIPYFASLVPSCSSFLLSAVSLMFARSPTAIALLAAASWSLGVQAISKVSRSGRYLYTDDGNRFYIRGIAYQEQGQVDDSNPDNPFLEPSSFTDPLIDGSACSRDLPFLQQLNVNTIRVYSVDSSQNHDSCMQTFSDAGIYTIIDLALPLNGSIDRTSPAWSTNLLDQYIKTIDTFSKYDNVLAYNVGNEVVVENGTAVAPYIKAAARDIKAYLNSKSSSALVGYAAIDGSPNWRDPLANFLSCDPSGQNNGDTAIDIYGLNNYEWCGDSSFQSAYAGTNGDYAGYNVVAYFSEFGCITQPPRLWTEVAALFSSQMSDIWSGGIAFSYFPARSAQGEFGMVTISGNSVTTSDDFNRLKAQYGNVSAPNTPSQSSASTSYPACPTQNSTFVASTSLPPTPNEAACDCLENTLSCRFTPQTANYSAVVGEVINTACGLLGQQGGNCNDIGGDGSTGSYGRLSGCDPLIKTSFVMSEFYELNNRQGEACSFAGNGTVNPLAPSGVSAANTAASSCVSNPGATFTPAPSGSSGSGSGSGNGATSGGNNGSARGLMMGGDALVGIIGVVVVGVVSGVWTLL